MPLIRKPTTQELEDHFFGSGAFMWGWFDYKPSDGHFPVTVLEIDNEGDGSIISRHLFTEEEFVRGIKMYAEQHPTRTFDDLIEDMDAVDVDNCIQLAFFGEIRYA